MWAVHLATLDVYTLLPEDLYITRNVGGIHGLVQDRYSVGFSYF